MLFYSSLKVVEWPSENYLIGLVYLPVEPYSAGSKLHPLILPWIIAMIVCATKFHP